MNPTANYDFTIIVPVYNEEDNAAALEERLAAYLPTAARKACVLFVNDGSKDDSGRRIAEICSRQPDMFYISFERNCEIGRAHV